MMRTREYCSETELSQPHIQQQEMMNELSALNKNRGVDCLYCQIGILFLVQFVSSTSIYLHSTFVYSCDYLRLILNLLVFVILFAPA